MTLIKATDTARLVVTPEEQARLDAPGTVYMGPERGPFRCDNCPWFDGARCVHPKVLAPVNVGGCCNHFKETPEEANA